MLLSGKGHFKGLTYCTSHSRKASPSDSVTLVMVKHGAVQYVFNDWPVQWKSAETIFLCHLRVDTEAVGLELGQFDRVIQHCAILADGLISTSVGTTFPVIESSNDTFPSSMLLIYNNICFNLLLNLYIYRKMSQNFTLLLGLQRFSKSYVCTCRAAS